LAAAVIVGALFYALRIVLYQSLSIEEYGLFYAVFAFGVAMQAAVTFGFDPGVTPVVARLYEQESFAEIKQLAAASLVWQLGLAVPVVLVCLVLGDPVAVLLFDRADASVLFLPIVVYVLLMVVFKTNHAVLLGLHAVQARNVIDVVRVAVALATAVALLQAGWGVRAAAWAYAVSAGAAIGGQIMAVFLRARPVVSGAFTWRFVVAKEVFRSGKHLSVAFVGLLLFSQIDTLMLTLLTPDFAAAVGTYQVAVPTIMIAYGLLAAVGSSFMPMVTKLDVRGERTLLAGGIDRMYSAAFAVFLPVSFAAAGLGDVLMAVLFRRDTYGASEAFAILASGCIFYFVCYLNLQVMAGLGMVRRAGAAIAGALAINIVLNATLIPFLGICGAALATVCSFAAGAAATSAFIVRELQQPFRVHGITASTAAAVAVAVAVQWIRTLPPFLEHPYLVGAVAGLVLPACAIAGLETAGFVRLRELAAIITARRVAE
jgi:O-antigen/teichoic acid export membrane protein